MKLTRLLLYCVLLLPVLAFAQGGSGDLPPVTKTTTTKPKPKPTPVKPKTTPTKTTPTSSKTVIAKEPARLEPIAFDQIVEGKIEAQTAGRQPPNVYYVDYLLTATDADLFRIQVNSPNAAVKLELLDTNKILVPLKRDEQSGQYQLNTPGYILPTDGEYRVRVSVAPSPTLAAAVLFTLKVEHTGLTAAGYQERLQQIVKGFDSQKPDETIAQLERLVQDDAKQAGAYEYLGLLYNMFKQNQPKASAMMLQAIKLGGAAIFRISHDRQWKRPARDKQAGRPTFPELKTSWLRISSQQLGFADFNTPDKALLAFTREQIKEVSRVAPTPLVLVKHNNKLIKPDIISFAFASPTEAELAVDFIKGNLLGKE